MPIARLSKLLINQIAAGEVIERPASVVKELAENSLDAGAGRIDIAIEQGGGQLIRVADDGFGIPAQELPLAVEPHATSKITTSQQLEAIGTLGFRGEALASAASVSRLRLVSRATRDGRVDEAAHELRVEGDRVDGPSPCAGSPGTVVEVRDLFFNTPARRKFMRTASTEFGHINDAVTRIAIMHPGGAFCLTHNGRKVLDLEPHDNDAQRAVALLGKDVQDGMQEFEQQEPASRGGLACVGFGGDAAARSGDGQVSVSFDQRPAGARSQADPRDQRGVSRLDPA